MPTSPQPLDERTLLGAVRLGVLSGAEQIHFRAGALPLFSWRDGARQLQYRQLTQEDVQTIVRVFLERAFVPERMLVDPSDAAHVLTLRCEMPGEALLEVSVGRERCGLTVSVDIVRPLDAEPEAALR